MSLNEARVLRALTETTGDSTPEDLAKRLDLADSAIARAILALSQNGLVEERVDKRTEVRLSDEGNSFAGAGLPERQIVSIVRKKGGRLSLNEALNLSGLDAKYGPIAAGW